MGGDDGESPIHATLGFLTQILSGVGSGCKVACLTDSELKWVFVTLYGFKSGSSARQAVPASPSAHHTHKKDCGTSPQRFSSPGLQRFLGPHMVAVALSAIRVSLEIRTEWRDLAHVVG